MFLLFWILVTTTIYSTISIFFCLPGFLLEFMFNILIRIKRAAVAMFIAWVKWRHCVITVNSCTVFFNVDSPTCIPEIPCIRHSFTFNIYTFLTLLPFTTLKNIVIILIEALVFYMCMVNVCSRRSEFFSKR